MKRKISVLSIILWVVIAFTSCVTNQKSLEKQALLEEQQQRIETASADAWMHFMEGELESALVEFTGLSEETLYISSAYRGLAANKLAFENGTDIFPIVESLILEEPENPQTYALLRFVEENGLYEHEQYSLIMEQLSRQLNRNNIPQWLKREYAYLLFDFYYNRTGALLSADSIKKDFEIIEGWEILGPFSNVSGSGFRQDFIPVSAEHKGLPESEEGGLNNWTLQAFSPQCGNKDIIFPVSNFLSSLEYTSAYAYKEITIEEAGFYHLILSRKGSLECWLDGEKIIEDGSYREAVNAYYIPMDLSEGDHQLVIKLNNREEGSFFNASLVVAEEDVRPESSLYHSLFPDQSSFDPLLLHLCLLAEQEDSSPESWFWLYLSLLSKDWNEQAREIFPHLEKNNSCLSSWLNAMYFQNIGEWALYDRDMIALGEEAVLAPGIEYLMNYYISTGRIGTLEDFLENFAGNRLHYERTLARMQISMFHDKEDVMSFYYALVERYPHTAKVHQVFLNKNRRISYGEKNNFIGFLLSQGYYRLGLISRYSMNSYNSLNSYRNLADYVSKYPDDEWAWTKYIQLLADHDDYGYVSQESRTAIGSFPYSYNLLDIEYDRSYWLYYSMKQYYDENRSKITQAGTSGQSFVKEMNDEKEFYRSALEKLVNLYPYSLFVRDQLRELDEKDTFIDNILHKYPVEYIQYYEEENWDSGDSDAVVVLDENSEVYFCDGGSRIERQLIMKMNTALGVEDNRYYYLPFYTRQNSSRVREAFVLKADGTRVFAEITGYKVAFSGLEAGDYLVIRYNYDSYIGGDLNKYFWTSVALSGKYPVFTCKYEIVYPEDQELQIKEHNLEPKMFKMTTSDFIEGFKKLEISSTKMEAVPFGILTPSWRDVTPWIDITTVDSWETIVQWYDNMTRGQTEESYQLKQTVESLCKDASTEREKIQRIFSFVSAGIEYEDLDFMYTAQIPQTADSVLKEGYGDCKDQTALLVAMLKIAGIDSYFMLSSPGYKGGAPYLPSGRFSHVIAAVDLDQETLFLDPTTRRYTLGEVPASMKDTYVLPIVTGKELIPLEPNLENQKSLVVMEFDNILGTPRIIGDLSFQGDLAGYYRYRMKGESEPFSQEIFQLMLNQWLPGFELSELSMNNMDDLFYDPSAHFTGSIQSVLFPAISGGIRQLSFPWINILDDMPHSWIALEGTGSGVEIEDYKSASPVTQVLVYHLPASGRVQTLPRDQTFEFGNSYIRYSYKQEGSSLICTRDLWIQEHHIPQDQLEAFQAFILQGLLKEKENAFIRF